MPSKVSKTSGTETTVPTVSRKYASFGRRFLAYSIDSFVVAVITVLLSLILVSVRFQMGWIPGIVVAALYYLYFWTQKDGQTVGNKMLAIRVVKEDSGALDIGGALLRFVGYMVSGLVFYLGFLWVLWDPKKQGWHDKLAKTIVVETDQKPKMVLAIAIVTLLFMGFVIFMITIGIGIAAFTMYMMKNPGKLPSNNYTLPQNEQMLNPTSAPTGTKRTQ